MKRNILLCFTILSFILFPQLVNAEEYTCVYRSDEITTLRYFQSVILKVDPDNKTISTDAPRESADEGANIETMETACYPILDFTKMGNHTLEEMQQEKLKEFEYAKNKYGCPNSIYMCKAAFKEHDKYWALNLYLPLINDQLRPYIENQKDWPDDNNICTYSVDSCYQAYIDKKNSTEGVYIIESSFPDTIYTVYINQMKDYSCYKKSNCEKKLQKYNEAKQNLISYCSTRLKFGHYTDDAVQSCLNIGKDISDIEGLNLSDVNSELCGLGDKLTNWIRNILKWIKYILPVLVIILGIVDFIKAIASDNDDEMKKAQQRFIKRLIAAALVFIIPFLIEFVLKMFKIGDNPFCGILK